MPTQPTVYTDDPDASWTYTIKSRDDTSIDWATPVVAIGSGDYEVTATWDSDAGVTRTLRVPLVGLDGTRGGIAYLLYLRVPSGTDILLGTVTVKVR